MKLTHGQYKCKDHDSHTNYDTSNRVCKECKSKLKRYCQQCDSYYDASNFSKHVKTHRESCGADSCFSTSKISKPKHRRANLERVVPKAISPSSLLVNISPLTSNEMIPNIFLSGDSLKTRSVAPPQQPMALNMNYYATSPHCGHSALLDPQQQRLITPNHAFIGLQQPFIIQGVPVELPTMQNSNQTVVIRAEFKKSDEEREEVDLTAFPGYLYGSCPLWMYGPALVTVTVMVEVYQGLTRVSKKWFKVSDFYFASSEMSPLSPDTNSNDSNKRDDDNNDDGDDDSDDKDSDEGHDFSEDDLLFHSSSSSSDDGFFDLGAFDFMEQMQLLLTQQQPDTSINKQIVSQFQQDQHQQPRERKKEEKQLSQSQQSQKQSQQKQPYVFTREDLLRATQGVAESLQLPLQLPSQLPYYSTSQKTPVQKDIGLESSILQTSTSPQFNSQKSLQERHSNYNQSFALVIGCSKYQEGALESLTTRSDCRNLSTALQDVGFNVQTLQDAQVTKRNIYQQLFSVFRRMDEHSRLLIHLSGHGQVVENKCTQATTRNLSQLGYFCCSDYSPANMENTTVFYKDLQCFISQHCPVGGQVVLSLDCCHSGSALQMDQSSISGASKDCNLFVIASSQPGELSHETMQGGLFTTALCNVLNAIRQQPYHTIETIATKVASIVQQASSMKQSPKFGYCSANVSPMVFKTGQKSAHNSFPLYPLNGKYRGVGEELHSEQFTLQVSDKSRMATVVIQQLLVYIALFATLSNSTSSIMQQKQQPVPEEALASTMTARVTGAPRIVHTLQIDNVQHCTENGSSIT